MWLFFVFLFPYIVEAKLPEITPKDVTEKSKEIMKAHASFKTLTPELSERILNNYLEELDPNKTYFIESDIEAWLHPSEETKKKIIQEYEQSRFTTFEQIHAQLLKAIQRRRGLEQQIDKEHLPTGVKAAEFKDMKWTKSEQELVQRLSRIKALQFEGAAKLNGDLKEKSLQRIDKHQKQFEDEFSTEDPVHRQKLILSRILKATAASLDSNSAYFTPDEAAQFMIHVQQRLFGIGAQLRDDLNGFSVVKIVEGSPSDTGKALKVKDRIIAVNGEPVVGMNIIDAVELIRGEENTPVVLTVIREISKEDGTVEEQKLDVTVLRGEVVLKESRYKSDYQPFGNGVIGYLKLFSFYQDREFASATDLTMELEKLKKEHNLLGVILDLRFNSGGLLAQAVDVSSLFIKNGVVVSVKDENGRIQHLRNTDGKVEWDGPLIILVNRASASASEIVAQTLMNYGRALVVGDDRTYGKGSYQTFTLNSTDNEAVNPQGEYKVTRGRYYTVSGETPQQTGVATQIVIPGPLSEEDIGEKFSKYPLANDQIKPSYQDDFSDIPFLQRDRFRRMYQYGRQERLDTYVPYIEALKKNSSERISHSANYQNFLKELKKKDDFDSENIEAFGQNDIQLDEAYHIMKDMLMLMQAKGITIGSKPIETYTDNSKEK